MEVTPAFERLLQAQHGAFSRRQAIGCGVSESQIRTRVRRGQWIRVFPGVFGLAGLPRLGQLQAALLYAGPGAVLCGLTAAERIGLMPVAPTAYVGVPTRRRVKSQPGLRIVRMSELSDKDAWVRDGLPTTRPERTLVDLLRHLPRRETEAVMCTALQRGLTTTSHVRSTAERIGLLPRRSWFARLLNDIAQGAQAIGELELLRLCRRHRLPAPAQQSQLGERRRADAGWPALRVYVEIDSLRYHYEAARWQADLTRQNEVMAETGGVCLLRFTTTQIRDEPRVVATVIRRALKSARHRQVAMAGVQPRGEAA